MHYIKETGNVFPLNKLNVFVPDVAADLLFTGGSNRAISRTSDMTFEPFALKNLNRIPYHFG